ncbi:MAG: cation:proton antiporter [Nanoarchaeota archaeon]|jgi:CPA2 family monovalent cation:H+ antiporter-2|nr:cation:proton antiporter [Nanoarchaeota archaeon]
MDVNIFIFLAVFFISVFLLGRLFEKFKIPWIFSSLLIGVLLAIKNPFGSITSSVEFGFMANLGMLFLLFIIGFEIDLKKMRKFAGFIVKGTFFIILVESLVGMFLIHFVFNYGWFISFIVGASFATVGEAILIPILDEFKFVKTRLGQVILGIGSFDDIFEIMILVIIVLFYGIESPAIATGGILMTIIAFVSLFVLTSLFIRLKSKGQKFSSFRIETLFLLSLAVLFLFIGIGEFSGSSALAALLAGISLKTFLPVSRIKSIESEMKSLCYGFFAPIFFLSVGLALNVGYIVSSFWLLLLIFFASTVSKLVASYMFAYKKLGKKDAILLGIGLSARFSTSIVIIKILLDSGLIQEGLYSIIVASSVIFTLVIPILFSKLIVKWKVNNGK